MITVLLSTALAVPLLAAQDSSPIYRLYVAAESSDEVYSLAFDGSALSVTEVVSVGRLPTEIEGPHGLTVDPEGSHWFVTLAHGKPWGSLLKYTTADNHLVGSTELGLFPATMQISVDTGLLYCVNFDLHGDMSPSTVSIVDPEAMVEVARTETGPMPHGSRFSPDGRRHYSCAMMSDELIELDSGCFEVLRRLHLTDGTGRMPPATDGEHAAAVCKPTWVVLHPETDTDPDPDPIPGSTADPDQKPRFARAYVCLNGAAQVVEVDLDNWRIRRRFPTAKGPYNLDLTPSAQQLVVTYKGDASVAVWDLQSGQEKARIPTTRRVPHGVVVAPDGRFAFVSNEGIGAESGTVDVLDLETLERVTSVEVGLQAGGIAFWKIEERAP